jgi:3-deoxy-D-manno-octulosonic acid (KDO) 8-phosphate synthase
VSIAAVNAPLAGRLAKPAGTVVGAGGVDIGGPGVAGMVGPMACAAIAAGADGLLIEVHAHPERALSDGSQSLSPGEFAALMRQLAAMAAAAGRSLA